MNNTVRIALAVAYAAVGIWALMPTPPPPPTWERPRYERPVPAPRPRRSPPEDMVQPDEYRGSADEIATAAPVALHPEPVRRPSVEMEPADLWALANLRFKELPPIEFDHMPDRPVTTTDIRTEADLRVRCGWPPAPAGGILVGCADILPFTSPCRIYLGPTGGTGVTRNIVLRHEIGHCNGWGKDHAGIR
jgi:hypothetical protein